MSVGQILWLIVVCGVMLAFVLWFSWWVAGRLGFSRESRIAVEFCGSKKSMATGLPMAAVLFAGQPVGLIALPLMIFHQMQLMACSALAQKYSRDPDLTAEPDTPA